MNYVYLDLKHAIDYINSRRSVCVQWNSFYSAFVVVPNHFSKKKKQQLQTRPIALVHAKQTTNDTSDCVHFIVANSKSVELCAVRWQFSLSLHQIRVRLNALAIVNDFHFVTIALMIFNMFVCITNVIRPKRLKNYCCDNCCKPFEERTKKKTLMYL